MTTDPTENTSSEPVSEPTDTTESFPETASVPGPEPGSSTGPGAEPESTAQSEAASPEPVSASEPAVEPASWAHGPSLRSSSPRSDAHMASPAPPRRHFGGYIIALAVLAALGIGGWRGWVAWQAYADQWQARSRVFETQLESMGQQIEVLNGDLRSQSQRLTDAASANRALREELFGLDQRGKLLEESVAKLAEASQQNIQAAHLGEVELLLTFGAERLNIAGDVEGARRIYTLASNVLNDIEGDASVFNLRQTLAQEQTALEELGAGPQVVLAERLNQLAASLDGLPTESPAAADRPLWQRWLAPLLDIRPSQQRVLLAPTERAAAEAALQIEFSLARAALARSDDPGFDQALARSGAWLTRLWPDSPALRAYRDEIDALRQMPLRPDLPVLGATLQQLRMMRDGRDTP